MQTQLDILRDVSYRLESAAIDYMLTGSMAMNHYAQPRMTRDIDLVLAISGAADALAVVKLFSPDYYISDEAVRSSVAHESMFNAIHLETVIKVDCIIRKSTAYRKTEFERRQRVTIENFSVWITTKEDLMISKLYWAKDSLSELQLGDVRNLVGSGYDSVYLEAWTDRLGLSDLWSRCQ